MVYQMIDRQRFEAVFDEGDEDRYATWKVVEWTFTNPVTKARKGKTVVNYCINEYTAVVRAAALNREYEMEQSIAMAQQINGCANDYYYH